MNQTCSESQTFNMITNAAYNAKRFENSPTAETSSTVEQPDADHSTENDREYEISALDTIASV